MAVECVCQNWQCREALEAPGALLSLPILHSAFGFGWAKPMRSLVGAGLERKSGANSGAGSPSAIL